MIARPLTTVLTLTAIYAVCLLLTWLALGLGQAVLTGHRFFDDDVGAALATALIPITTAGGALGFATMAAWVLRPTYPPVGLRMGLITAVAGPVSLALLWVIFAAISGVVALIRPTITGSGPAFAYLVGIASLIGGALAMWLEHRLT